MLSEKKKSRENILGRCSSKEHGAQNKNTHIRILKQPSDSAALSLTHTFGSCVGSRASDEHNGWKEPTLHVRLPSRHILTFTQREVIRTNQYLRLFPNTPQCLLIINGFWFIPFSLDAFLTEYFSNLFFFFRKKKDWNLLFSLGSVGLLRSRWLYSPPPHHPRSLTCTWGRILHLFFSPNDPSLSLLHVSRKRDDWLGLWQRQYMPGEKQIGHRVFVMSFLSFLR